MLSICLLWCCLVLPAPGHSQAESPWTRLQSVTFQHVSSEDGLAVGAVVAVTQDSRGFIWLATSDGLYRWDGRRARRFGDDERDFQEDLRTLQAAPDGSLWLGGDLGVRRFDPRREHTQTIDTGPDLGAVVNIAFDPGATAAWLAREKGITRVDLISGETNTVWSSAPDRVFQVRVTADGTVWAASESGLLRRPPGGAIDAFARVELPGVALNTRIASLATDASGGLWVGTARNGVFYVASDGQITAPYAERFSGEWIYSLAVIREGVVWLGTFGQGIIEISEARGWRRIQHDRLIRRSLAADSVWSISSDRDGRVWVGTSRGASMHDPAEDALVRIFGDTDRPSPIRDARVRSVLYSQNDRLWLGLGESGVDIITPDRGRVDSIRVDPESTTDHLPRGAVEVIAELSDASHLIGSNWGLYHRRGDQLRRIDTPGFPHREYVGSLAIDARGVLAGGTNGLWRLRRKDDDWLATAVPAELTDQRVSVLLTLPDGGSVVGTWGGINWLDNNDRLLGQSLQPGPESPFPSGFVSTLRLDAMGRLWVGTDNGLYRFASSEPQASWRRLGNDDGLPSTVIRSLEFDAQGRAWVATNKGLSVIDPDQMRVLSGTRGLASDMAPFSRNASDQSDSGELLFAGDGGLVLVQSGQWQPRVITAPMAMLDIQLDDEPIADPSLGREPEQPIVIPPGTRSLHLDFAALTYGVLSPQRYRYRLNGLDPDWRLADPEHRNASYTTLDPGDYHFEVQSEDGLGGWADNRLNLYFQVQSAWYQQLWARMLALALMLALLYGLFVWRTHRLRQRQRQLERMVSRRTAALEASTRALREKTRALERASTTDPLTGLRNRRFLDQHLPDDISSILRLRRDWKGDEKTAPDLMFFLIDLDHFKQLNDEQGHAAGDEVLMGMRHRLQKVFRETDYLVRWGGEEFLVVARNSNRSRASEIAQRLRDEIKHSAFRLSDDTTLKCTCSIGVAAFPFYPDHPDAMTWTECVELADQALYAAKNAGRDAWVVVEAGSLQLPREQIKRMRTDFYFMCLQDVLRLRSNRSLTELETLR